MGTVRHWREEIEAGCLQKPAFTAPPRHLNRNPHLCLYFWFNYEQGGCLRDLNISSNSISKLCFRLHTRDVRFQFGNPEKCTICSIVKGLTQKVFLVAKKHSWHGEESAFYLSAGDLRPEYSTRPALRLISRQKLSKLNDWYDNKLNKKFIITNKRMEKWKENLQSLQLCSANDHTLFRGFGATVKHNSAAQTCGIFKWNLWEFWNSCAAGKISPVFLQNFFNFLRFLLPGTMDLIKPNNTGEIKNLTPSRLLLPSVSLAAAVNVACCLYLTV